MISTSIQRRILSDLSDLRHVVHHYYPGAERAMAYQDF